jgi:hypothetical protein
MTSTPDEPLEDSFDDTTFRAGLADEAPEADVVEQHRSASRWSQNGSDTFVVPPEADPADAQEQYEGVGNGDEDDYR